MGRVSVSTTLVAAPRHYARLINRENPARHRSIRNPVLDLSSSSPLIAKVEDVETFRKVGRKGGGYLIASVERGRDKFWLRRDVDNRSLMSSSHLVR